MGHRQKGKHMKRKKSWHRFSDDRRFRKAMKRWPKELAGG